MENQYGSGWIDNKQQWPLYIINVNARDRENRKYKPGEGSFFPSGFTNILAAFLSKSIELKQYRKTVFDILPN